MEFLSRPWTDFRLAEVTRPAEPRSLKTLKPSLKPLNTND
jgi:hypothetical protein